MIDTQMQRSSEDDSILAEQTCGRPQTEGSTEAGEEKGVKHGKPGSVPRLLR
jgi:hypothetical protein